MSQKKIAHLLHHHIGSVAYDQALKIQCDFHEKVKAGSIEAVVLTLEHPSTLTLGKHAKREYLLADTSQLQSLGVKICQTDRGGEITAHMPGQLVVYPILPISLAGLSPRRYVDILCESVIDTLNHYGIHGRQDEKFPGVWVGNDKICAIGIRIKSKVTMHGLALNVDNSLGLFSKIVPCGIKDRGVTNMKNLLNVTPTLHDVCLVLMSALSKKLGLEIKVFSSK